VGSLTLKLYCPFLLLYVTLMSDLNVTIGEHFSLAAKRMLPNGRTAKMLDNAVYSFLFENKSVDIMI